MTFREEYILATLSEWQGTTLSAEEVANLISYSDVRLVRRTLDELADDHYPVVKLDGGYTIPNNSMSDYIVGMGLFSLGLVIPLLFF